jgi:uncharacterized protein (DUF433 family)
MAQDAPTYANRIVHNPTNTAGTAVVKGTQISVEMVLARLSASLDVDALLQEYPRLTRDDVRAVLDYAQAHLTDQPSSTAAVPLSPQDFYQAATQREDIRRILAALAK